MTTIILRLFAVATLLGLTACTKKPLQLDVQVFIVTKGGENVKLGLVEVGAIPADKAAEALRPVIAERDAALSKLRADKDAKENEFAAKADQNKRELEAATVRKTNALEGASRAAIEFQRVVKAAASAVEPYADSVRKKLEVDILDPRYSTVSEQIRAFEQKLDSNGLDESSGFYTHPARAIEIVSREVWKGIPDHRDAVLKAAQSLQTLQNAIASASDAERRLSAPPDDDFRLNFLSEHTQLMAPKQLGAALPRATITAKTDADGRCRLILPANQKWILAAVAGRQVMKDREEYAWIVEAPQTKEPSASIALSNDNLLNPGAKPLGL